MSEGYRKMTNMPEPKDVDPDSRPPPLHFFFFFFLIHSEVPQSLHFTVSLLKTIKGHRVIEC